MNNERRRLYRKGLTVVSGITVFFGILAGLNVEFSFYNHFNPFFNSPLMIGFAFVFYILRNYIRDKKETTTMAGFFDTSGLTDAYDIEPGEEDSTHIKYQDEQGETISVKKGPPLLLPTDDGYERLFFIPRKGRKALDPKLLVEKYAQKLTKDQVKTIHSIPNLTSEEKKILDKIPEKIEGRADILKLAFDTIPEIEALIPEQLYNDMTEQDEPDTLFEEFTHHVAEIRRAVQDLLGQKPSFMTLIMYGGIGALAMLILMILGHADFSRVTG